MVSSPVKMNFRLVKFTCFKHVTVLSFLKRSLEALGRPKVIDQDRTLKGANYDLCCFDDAFVFSRCELVGIHIWIFVIAKNNNVTINTHDTAELHILMLGKFRKKRKFVFFSAF